MRLFGPTPRCVLVLAPHADDETIGAHALMGRLRRAGVEIRVVVVTDGAASHPSSQTWPRRRLVRERRRETRREMRRIGVTAGDITFLGLPDGGLREGAAVSGRRITAAIDRAPTPLLIMAPAARDDHPDHRAVAAAARAARRARSRLLSYPVWPPGRRLPAAVQLSLTTQERLAKRHAIRRYRTQTGRITDDPAGFAMTRAQIAAFSRPIEAFVVERR